MRFNAEYRYKTDNVKPYYRTVFADCVNEAVKRAERYTKKGYICVEVKSCNT